MVQEFWKEMYTVVTPENSEIANWVTSSSALICRATMGFMCLYLMRFFTKTSLEDEDAQISNAEMKNWWRHATHASTYLTSSATEAIHWSRKHSWLERYGK